MGNSSIDSLLESALKSKKKKEKKSKGKGADMDMDLEGASAESSPEAKKAQRAKRRVAKSGKEEKKETKKSREATKKAAKKAEKKAASKANKKAEKTSKKASGRAAKSGKFDMLKALSGKPEKAGKLEVGNVESIGRHLAAAMHREMRSTVNVKNVVKTFVSATKDSFGVSVKGTVFDKAAAEIYSTLVARMAKEATKAISEMRKEEKLTKDDITAYAESIVNGEDD